ncbi:hypothetical protein lerEdw1_010421 [Lerista edwardsae]|nr:hypothetical protein lerEdw1_010421 [Lerista edwardsae]
MDREDLNSCRTLALVTDPQFAQLSRKYLQREGVLNRRYRVQRRPDGTVVLPVVGLLEQQLTHLKESIPAGGTCALMWIQNPVRSKAAQVHLPSQKLRDALRNLVLDHGATWSEELERDLPSSWQRHGDLVLLREDSFRAALWGEMGPKVWETMAGALGAQRVAKRGRVQSDLFRTPTVTLLLGQDGWVEHVDNGIRYTFDVTRCMLSPGNITEKLRIASFQCAGEVVVDLYAGIGYFTLPYLVHAQAAFVHACEWNPHAVEALEKTLKLNGVQDRCRVHQGDNRKTSQNSLSIELPVDSLPLCFPVGPDLQLELRDVCHRVNLGLIPTAEEGWPIACKVLRKDTGGVLHIHQNVESFSVKAFQPGQREWRQLLPPQVPPPGQEDQALHVDHSSPQDAGKSIPDVDPRCEWQRWAEATGAHIRTLLQELDSKPWRTNILHIECVKSYAPHVHHLVLDLECRPLS